MPGGGIEPPTRGFSIGECGSNGSDPTCFSDIFSGETAPRDPASLITPHPSHIDLASPRARIVASLAQAMVAALDAGDAEAARVAHDAIGRLLRGRQGDGAEVVDLATWRAQK